MSSEYHRKLCFLLGWVEAESLLAGCVSSLTFGKPLQTTTRRHPHSIDLRALIILQALLCQGYHV